MHARRLGDRVWELQLIAGSVSALVLLGRWDEAFELAAESERLPGGEEEVALVHLVEIDCWRGRLDDARARLDRYAAGRDSDELEARLSYALHEAMVLRAEGKPRVALEALEPVLVSRDKLGVKSLIVKLGLVEALECAFELGETAKLEELLGIVDALRPGERPPLLAAHVARVRARSATISAEAEAGFSRALELFRELDMVFWLAVTQLEHGEWLIREDRGLEAEPLFAEARATFERLEAKPWLDRVSAAESQQPARALA